MWKPVLLSKMETLKKQLQEEKELADQKNVKPIVVLSYGLVQRPIPLIPQLLYEIVPLNRL
jgi:hypothetical protein